MSDSVEGLKVVIAADVANLVAGMKQAGATTLQASREMQASFVAMGAGAHEGGGGVEHLSEKLREFGSHAAREHRTAFQFARMLQGVGLDAKGAGGEIAGFIGAFAVGNGIGLAVESIKFLAHAFSELGAKEAEAREEMTKYANELAIETTKIQEAVSLQIMELNGASKAQIEAHKKIKPLIEEREELEEKEALLVDNITSAREVDAAVQTAIGAASLAQDEKELARLRERLALITKTIEKRQVAIGTGAAAVIGSDTADEKRKADEQEDAEGERNLARFIKRQEEKFHIAQKLLNDQSKAEYDAARKMDELFAHFDEEKLKRQKKIEQEEDKENKKREADVKYFVGHADTAFSHMFKSLLDGQKNMTQIVEDLMKGLVEATIDGLLKVAAQEMTTAIIGKAAAKAEAFSVTQGHIAEAVAGAAASQAFIPFVGPGLGAAAAAEMFGSLEAITGPLLASAAGGMMVPEDMLSFVHKDERILPARYSEGLDRLVLGEGAGAGMTIENHFNAPVDFQWWQANQGNILRTLEDAARRGRRW